MRCSSGKISDVSGAAAAGTNGEVHGWLVRRGDLWGCPGRPCLSQQGSRVLLGRRAEKRKARGQQTAGVKVVAMANEHQDLYETLGISATASDRDIKQAYRRLALRFHPDVNKEPDAQEKFLRIKSAYQTLSDPSSRIRYDAVRRRGDESWSPFGGWGSSGAKSKEDEEFYGLGEFFRDLENDLNKRQQEMAEGKGKSLWEELAELGEEFVEFLEKELTIPSPGQAQNSWGGASPNGSESEQRERSKTSAGDSSRSSTVRGQKGKATVDWQDIGKKVEKEVKEVNEKVEQEVKDVNQRIEDDIEKMLSELKREMGL